MTIIDKIFQLKNELGLTNKEIETGAGLANSSMSQWAKGKGKPSLENIIKLSLFFHVTSDYLLCLSENREGNPSSGSACSGTADPESSADGSPDTGSSDIRFADNTNSANTSSAKAKTSERESYDTRLSGLNNPFPDTGRQADRPMSYSILKKQPPARHSMNEEESILIQTYRTASVINRFRIIQLCMNIQDETEQSKQNK